MSLEFWLFLQALAIVKAALTAGLCGAALIWPVRRMLKK